MGGEVEHRRPRAPSTWIDRLQHANVRVDRLVRRVGGELIREQVRAGRLPVEEDRSARSAPGGEYGFEGPVEDVSPVVRRHSTPDAHHVGAAVRVVGLDDHRLGGERATGASLDLEPQVAEARVLPLDRGEPALRLLVGDHDGVVAAADDDRAGVDAAPEDPRRRPALKQRRPAEAVSPEVHGLALPGTVGLRVDRPLGDADLVAGRVGIGLRRGGVGRPADQGRRE